MLLVSEIFCSIQGESSFAGLPCVFIRLSGCNLRCTYCDTAYAYHDGKKLSIPAIIKKVRAYKISHVEITGGEPLFQARTADLAHALIKKKFRVLIETNGSLDIRCLPKQAIKIMDIKCPASGQSQAMLWPNLNYLGKKDEVKFVISSRRDYLWAKQQMKKYRLAQKCSVLFSPVFKKQNPAKLAEWILKDRLPVRFQLQLHKILWPKRSKGV